MSQEPGPGDCVKFVTKFPCGCPPEWDWDCRHDDDIPHGLQRTFVGTENSIKACGRPYCLGEHITKSDAKQEESTRATSDQQRTSACLQYVIIFTCGHKDDADWDCWHPEGIKHDSKPDIDTLYSDTTCGKPNCSGAHATESDATHVVSEDGVRRPIRRKGAKRRKEETPEELDPVKELENIEEEFKIPRGGNWEERGWERPMPEINPYEGTTEAQNRAYVELRIKREREEDYRRWKAASETAKQWEEMKIATVGAERENETKQMEKMPERPQKFTKKADESER